MSKHQLFSIANQLRYGLVSMVVSSLVLAGGALTYLSYQAQLEQTKLLQQERSRSAASEISAYLDNLQRQLNYLSELRGLTEFDRANQRSVLEGLVKSNSAYEIVGIMNDRGQIVQTMSPYKPISLTDQIPGVTSTGSTAYLFVQAFKNGENYISPVEIDPEINLPVATVAVPIRNRQSQINGVLFAKVNLNFLSHIVSRTEVGKTGYTYILDNRFVLISSKGGTTNTFKLQDLKDRPFIKNLSQLAVSPNTKRFIIYQGLNGERVLGAATLVRRVQWTVVVELPTSEVYAPVRQMVFVMGGATLIVTLVGFILGFAFSKSIVLPLQRLTNAAAQISDGHFESRVEIASGNELGQLAKSFNSMAHQLHKSFATLEAKNTEMKALNQALSESESRLAQFLDAIPVGVFVTDRHGKPYYTNPTGKQILGQGVVDSTTALELREVYQAYLAGTEQLYPNDRNPIVKALKGEIAKIDDMEIHQPDKIIPLETSGRPIYDAQGNIAYAIVAFQDITERKKADKLLAEYNHSLERAVTQRTQELSQALNHLQATQQELIQSEKMAALGQLIAGIAHEINTPLGAIRSSVGNMSKFLSQTLEQLPALFQSLSPEESQIFLNLLQKSLQKELTLSAKEERQLKRALIRELEAEKIQDADTMADTLVDMGIYSGSEEFLPLFKKSECPDLVEIAYKLSGLQRGTKTIEAAMDRASKVVFALKTYARYDQLGKMTKVNLTEGIETILTLYQNQLKQGVEVYKNYELIPSVLCYPDELNQVWTNLIHNALQAMDYRGTLRIDLSQKDQLAEISITDSGHGISKEIQSKIFEPFFTTKPAGEGSGMGLDIVKKIIEKHSGKIAVESQPGRTTFTIFLPVEPSQEVGNV